MWRGGGKEEEEDCFIVLSQDTQNSFCISGLVDVFLCGQSNAVCGAMGDQSPLLLYALTKTYSPYIVLLMLQFSFPYLFWGQQTMDYLFYKNDNKGLRIDPILAWCQICLCCLDSSCGQWSDNDQQARSQTNLGPAHLTASPLGKTTRNKPVPQGQRTGSPRYIQYVTLDLLITDSDRENYNSSTIM